MWSHWGWMMGHSWGMWWLMPFGHFWFLVLIAVLLAVLFARGSHRPPRSPALDLLEQRYAKGEIGRDEYLEKKRDLWGGS